MPLSRFASAFVLGSVGFALAPAASGLQPSPLPHLLGAAAAYVATYEERVAAFVFEEDYRQRVTCLFGGTKAHARRLRSEVVVVNTGDLGWIGFRDVFEVDGQPVRNREDRLRQLFLDAGPDALARARALADESARFNLGGVQRNLNYPTMALLFLREAHQGRSRFSRGGSERVDGMLTWAVRFEETRRPTLIGSRVDDVVASGEFWIEPDAGRVRRSRLRVEEEHVPVSMMENHSVRGCDPGSGTVSARGVETIQGEAQYSNVRQFTVDVTM